MVKKVSLICIHNDLSSPLSLFSYSSFKKQEYQDIELLYGFIHFNKINKKSHNTTFLNAICNKDKRVKLYDYCINNTKSKITTGELYNDLISKCTGDIIYFIHPNIIYDKNYVNEMNNEMINNKVDFIVNDNYVLTNTNSTEYYRYNYRNMDDLLDYNTCGFDSNVFTKYKFKHIDNESCMIKEFLKNTLTRKIVSTKNINIIVSLMENLEIKKYVDQISTHNIKIDKVGVDKMKAIIINKIHRNISEVDMKHFGNEFILDIPAFAAHELPFVSIVTVTRNRKNMFKLPINNWIMTKYPTNKLEWLILDNSDHPIKDILPNDNRINYIHKNDFTNIADIRNYAVEKSKYNYVSFMDDDDYYYPDSVLAKIRVLLHYENKKCVYSSPLGIYNVLNNSSQIMNTGFDCIPEATLTFHKDFWRQNKFNNIDNTGEGYGMVKYRENSIIKIPFWFNTISITHDTNFTNGLREIKTIKGGHANFFDFFDTNTKNIIKEIF